jgi:N-glycosylase/DNA lyase
LEIKLNPRTTPFTLDHTLNCGQAFRWKKVDENWVGVVNETLVRISQRGNILDCETVPNDLGEPFVTQYFRLDDDLPLITSQIKRDTTIADAITRFHGLRILRQDPWECLISFICATYSNISRIRRMVQNLCQHFGHPISHKGRRFHSFPEKKTLADASINELLDCNLGYRAPYVKQASQGLVEDQLNLYALKEMSYNEAKASLKSVRGVGDKVADCVLLFSLDKLEAFPVDVRIRHILQTHYSHHFIRTKTEKRHMTPNKYKELNGFGRKYFGKHAGYAQEYLYARFSPHYMRHHQMVPLGSKNPQPLPTPSLRNHWVSAYSNSERN